MAKYLIVPIALIILAASGCAHYNTEPMPPTRSVANTPQRENRPQRRVMRQRQKQNIPYPTRPIVSPRPPQQAILAVHETEFNADEDARNTNITRAAESINGKVVKPGEVFSFNETVGPTIERRGYKKGMIYIDGEKSEGFGGGVCQVSSTLFVAAESAGMTIIERHDHSLPVAYAEAGKEAATSYGVIDFKFKNEKPYSVVIKSRVENGRVKVGLYEG